jgi:uncharacterized protein
MSWLVANGRVLASAEVAESRRARSKGLLGRNSVEGALVLPRCRWVHTVGMRFAIDVAHLDEHGVVMRTTTMRRHRIGMPVWRAEMVIEASAGAFERWRMCVGDVVEVRQASDQCGPNPPAPDHGQRASSTGNLRLAELAAAG